MLAFLHAWLGRDYVVEERCERQVAAIMQKTLEQDGSHGRKFFYAISRSVFTALHTSALVIWHVPALFTLGLHGKCVVVTSRLAARHQSALNMLVMYNCAPADFFHRFQSDNRLNILWF